MDTEEVPLLKIITVGNGHVGKTSLITRFCQGHFVSTYKQTLGVDFLQRTSFIPSLRIDVIFQLWDTSGQEEYRSLTRRYFRRSQAALLVFSVADRRSFEDLHTWRAVVLEECGDIPMFVVQNKSDLEANRAVSDEEVRAQALHWELPLRCVSVKENVGVESLFEMIAVRAVGYATESSHTIKTHTETEVRVKRQEQKVVRRQRLLAYCVLL